MKVYVVNKSSHDFSQAERYGTLHYLSEGPMNRFATCDIVRQFEERMKDSHPDDYIVLCSLNVMNSLACAIFASKHGKLNLLLFKEGTYLARNHVFNLGKE